MILEVFGYKKDGSRNAVMEDAYRYAWLGALVSALHTAVGKTNSTSKVQA